jgi:hypothetical protein
LHKQVIHGCNVYQPIEVIADDVTKEHGRIEHRKYELYNAVPILEKWPEWGIRKIIKVTRYREEISKPPVISESYYVTNGDLPLKILAKVIREHWFIENKRHYVKDVVFREDYARRRINPYPFSFCIDIALNICKMQDTKSIRSSLIENGLNFNKLMNNYGEYL